MFLIVKKKLSRGEIKISLIQREKERERIRGALFLPWIPSLKENVFSVFGWKRCTESQLFRRREKVAPVASGFLALGELRHFPSRAAKKVPFRLKTKPFNRFHRFSKYCEIRKKGTSQRFILPFYFFLFQDRPSSPLLSTYIAELKVYISLGREQARRRIHCCQTG